jgi:hypothetical protein
MRTAQENPPAVYSMIRPRFEVNISQTQIQKIYRYTVTVSIAPLTPKNKTSKPVGQGLEVVSVTLERVFLIRYRHWSRQS